MDRSQRRSYLLALRVGRPYAAYASRRNVLFTDRVEGTMDLGYERCRWNSSPGKQSAPHQRMATGTLSTSADDPATVICH
jgi:hypothetical protein